MKTKKLLLVAILTVLSLFVLAGCESQDLFLNEVIRETKSLDTASQAYVERNLTEEDGGVEALSLSYSETTVMTLSETTSDLQRFNELRLELISLHNQLVDIRESIRTNFNSIKTSVSTLKELNYIILDDDKTVIEDKISVLQGIKTDLEATSGLAYQRIAELRGTYTRENLENIITVFEEVAEVLELRINLFNQGLIELEIIDSILLEYLEE